MQKPVKKASNNCKLIFSPNLNEGSMFCFKKYLLVLVLFVFQHTVFAQIGNDAPDFTAVDTKGDTLHLYSYLEAGKVVVLDFFFTSCVPCQYYAPQVNLAYEKYGCNTADVIFIGIDWGDTDLQVIAYEEVFGIEYPSISGVEGGGTDIVNLYNVTSFPTFYIIDSTKTIIDQVDPPTLQVFDFRFGIHGIFPAECITTSSNESAKDERLQVYPNPVSFGEMYIDLPESLSGNAKLVIHDIYGKMVENEEVFLNGVSHPLSIDRLSPGTYMIKIETPDAAKTYSGLFVKL